MAAKDGDKDNLRPGPVAPPESSGFDHFTA